MKYKIFEKKGLKKKTSQILWKLIITIDEQVSFFYFFPRLCFSEQDQRTTQAELMIVMPYHYKISYHLVQSNFSDTVPYCSM